MTPHEWARRFAAAGIRVHPVWWTVTDVGGEDGDTYEEVCACTEGESCTSAGKHPIVSTSLSSTALAIIDVWWQQYPYANLGVNTDGLTVVDVDYRSGGLDSYNLVAPELEPTLRVQTGNGFHEYYRGEVGKAGGKLLKGVEFKSGPTQQVVGPGSTHWTGAEYEVVAGAVESIAPTPPRVYELVSSRDRTDGAPAVAVTAGEKIHHGEGNDALVAAAAFFANHSRTYEELVGHLFALSQASMDQPASQERLHEIARNRWDNHDGRFVDPALGAALTVKTRQGVITLRQLMEMPSPEWEIRDLIPSGGITVLYGDGGTKKSFVALDWALSAGLGLEWSGYQIRRRRTLYVAAEGVSGMPDRVRAWAHGHQLHVEQALEADVLIYPQAVNLVSAEHTAALVEVLRESGCDRLIVDTLRRAMPGGDENSTQDIGRVVDACARIRAEAEADVLLIHHSPATVDRPRGNTTIRDDADVVLGMRRVDAFTSTLHPSKLKDAPEFDPLQLEFRTASLEEEEDEPPRSSLYLARVGRDEEEVGAVRLFNVHHVDLLWTAIQGARMARGPDTVWTRAEIAALQTAPPTTMTRSLGRLEERGLIERVDRGTYRVCGQ